MDKAILTTTKTKIEDLMSTIVDLKAIIDDQALTLDNLKIENAALREAVKINNVGGR